MKPEIFATVMDFFNSGLPVVHEGAEISGDTEIYDDDDDTVQMIKVLFPLTTNCLLQTIIAQKPLSSTFRSFWTQGFVRQCRKMGGILSTWDSMMVSLSSKCRYSRCYFHLRFLGQFIIARARVPPAPAVLWPLRMESRICCNSTYPKLSQLSRSLMKLTRCFDILKYKVIHISSSRWCRMSLPN